MSFQILETNPCVEGSQLPGMYSEVQRSQTIKIFLKLPNNDPIGIELDQNDLVMDLHAAIRDVLFIPISTQKLFFNNHLLMDSSATLKSWNIGHESILHLLFRLRGGGCDAFDEDGVGESCLEDYPRLFELFTSYLEANLSETKARQLYAELVRIVPTLTPDDAFRLEEFGVAQCMIEVNAKKIKSRYYGSRVQQLIRPVLTRFYPDECPPQPRVNSRAWGWPNGRLTIASSGPLNNESPMLSSHQHQPSIVSNPTKDSVISTRINGQYRPLVSPNSTGEPNISHGINPLTTLKKDTKPGKSGFKSIFKVKGG